MHYCRRRCLYQATLDPRFHDEWRCVVVAEWEHAFDTYLEQVDQFEIRLDTAARIWRRRFTRLVHYPACENKRPGGEDDAVGCLHLYYDLCMLKLPACTGRCRYYAVQRAG